MLLKAKAVTFFTAVDELNITNGVVFLLFLEGVYVYTLPVAEFFESKLTLPVTKII